MNHVDPAVSDRPAKAQRKSDAASYDVEIEDHLSKSDQEVDQLRQRIVQLDQVIDSYEAKIAALEGLRPEPDECKQFGKVAETREEYNKDS